MALAHRLLWVAERIYGEENKSAPRRGILRGVVRYGAQTVPELARARGVTRQHVQEVVLGLVAEGLVELAPNPRHARSRLVRATPAGEALVVAMDRTDDRVLAAVGRKLPPSDLALTARTLHAVREAFEHQTKIAIAARVTR
jgi:DNA-binding MarR family transcriptional regulator